MGLDVFVRKDCPHWIVIVTPEAELPTAVLRGISYSGLPYRYCIYTGSSPLRTRAVLRLDRVARIKEGQGQLFSR